MPARAHHSASARVPAMRTDEDGIPEEFILNVGSLFGTLNCARIASDLRGFREWLKNEHGIEDFGPVFEGYRFFMESAIRAFLNAVTLESALDVKEDFVFHRARFVGVPIVKVPNTCEKTLLLKHIVNQLREISRAQDAISLGSAVGGFDNAVFKPFFEAFEKYVLADNKAKISKDEALRLVTMFYAYIYLNDTSRQIPHGYWVSMMDNAVGRDYHSKNFLGYKYCPQFLWSRLLGDQYRATSLVNMHRSAEWAIDDDDFDLEERRPRGDREDLDSYFVKVGDEIIRPLEQRLGLNLGFAKILYVEERVPTEEFRQLLSPLPEPQLSEGERLDFQLLWYSVELLDTSSTNIFSGVPAFISLLAGSAELVKRFSKGEDKALICKFVHPDRSVKGNDFSYGVLISAAGTSGLADYSGWMLFFDCCGDYSGFAGSEHAIAEAMIDVYKDRDEIEVHEMTIDKNRFKSYIAEKIVSGNREHVEAELERESERRRERNIVSEARGLITELITYYTLSKSAQGKVDWNLTQDGNQLDIVLEASDKVTLIECVLDPANMNADEETRKLRTKLAGIRT